MAWGTRHDNELDPDKTWDLTEGFLRPGIATETPEEGSRSEAGRGDAVHRHGPDGEPGGDDGAGNPLPREVEAKYGLESDEAVEAADDWSRADSDEARF